MSTKISDIKDYNSLYSAYSRLKNEGDGTVSAANAKNIFAVNMDIDGDNTAEIWEFMQRANEANKRTIFFEIAPLKQFQHYKYANISEDNPIRTILAVESRVVDIAKIKAALDMTDKIIGRIKASVTDNGYTGLSSAQNIVLSEFQITPQDGGVIFFSEGLDGNTCDCDTCGFIYMAVAHEMKWDVEFYLTQDHSYLKTNNIIFSPNLADDYSYDARYTTAGEHLMIGLAYMNRALRYYETGMANKAYDDICRAADIGPASYVFLFNKARVEYKIGRYEEALKTLDKIISLTGGDHTAFYSRGKIFNKLLKYPEALDDLTRSIALYGTAEAYLERSLAYRALGYIEKATEDMEMYKKLLAERSSTNH